MGSQKDIASFVLRFKQHARANAQGEVSVEWRGQICHVQEDQEMCFTDLNKAVRFIQATLSNLSVDGPALEVLPADTTHPETDADPR